MTCFSDHTKKIDALARSLWIADCEYAISNGSYEPNEEWEVDELDLLDEEQKVVKSNPEWEDLDPEVRDYWTFIAEVVLEDFS